jgi:tRNA(adenine34) deaminase
MENIILENVYMKKAIELAGYAASLGEVPIGAVIVKNGEIVGQGYNRRECDNSPIAHAEIIAIDNASKKLGSWRLTGCDLYVTLEPCPMCCGAIINSRISSVFFGAYDQKAGSVFSVQEMFSFKYNHKPEVYGGIMQKECSKLLTDFFSDLRKK